VPARIAIWDSAQDAWVTDNIDLFSELSAAYSETWPTSGTTRNGRAYARPTSAPPTDDSAFSSLLPTPDAQAGNRGERSPEALANGERQTNINDLPRLLPTPRTSDTNGAGSHGTGGPDLRTVASLLPTPTSRDHKGANQRQDGTCLTGALLPTILED
jgi:DNA (cytosine-5)-methyltransferase 1